MSDPESTITVNLPKFGEFTYRQAEVIEFPWGLPGFPNLRAFIVLALEEQPNFVWLQSVEDLNVAMPLIDPWALFPDYDPQLPQYAVVSLELERPEQFTVLCVTVVSQGGKDMTVNLRAPIIINLESRTGRQVTLDNAAYSIRADVPRVEGAQDEQEAISR